ncbi:hypothetical protein SFC43_32235 [Bacteroides sp. CR5/BHMF/2]|nr:hypothetical protein [Bacteroides sp. CR5/BHMF/2]
MEKKDIFQDIQNIRSSNPVIVLGSGASVSYGIPGMGVLANELKTSLNQIHIMIQLLMMSLVIS